LQNLDENFVTEGLATAEVQTGLGRAVTRTNNKLPYNKQMGLEMENVEGDPQKLQQEVDKEPQRVLVQKCSEWNKARLHGVAADPAAARLEGAPRKALLGFQLRSKTSI
jgi:hypothetical protein